MQGLSVVLSNSTIAFNNAPGAAGLALQYPSFPLLIFKIISFNVMIINLIIIFRIYIVSFIKKIDIKHTTPYQE